jgi:hypothetical protein
VPSQWFDGSLFADPPANGIRPGNASRGSILGPAAWRWDASLFKNTSISERVNVQFRVEATNVLNHANFDQIGTSFWFDPIHFRLGDECAGPTDYPAWFEVTLLEKAQ